MKLAVAGKGGSGKTSISGTMARVIARRGHRVLAIDGDTNPNLALTLGIPAERFNDLPVLPRDLLSRTDDGIELTKTLAQVRESHSLPGPDGVTLLVMAHPHAEDAGTGCFCGMHATVRTLIGSVSEADEDVCILDTEASPEHLTRGTGKYADLMLIVVEPWFKSLETGRRMAELAKALGVERVMLVANKVRDESELEAVREFADRHSLDFLATIPFDERLPEAEREGLAPLDYAAEGPAVKAIAELCESVIGEAASGNGAATGAAREPQR
jgi:CO dehydrogenase maturation factor